MGRSEVPGTGPGSVPLGRRVRRTVLRGAAALVVGSVLVAALWTWAALSFVYSKGERAGYVQKFSRKGWIFKTWEGELAMVNLPGAMPQVFLFSVRDPAAVRGLRDTMGRRIVLTYHEHRGLPPRLFGDTSYFVVGVRPMEEEPGDLVPDASSDPSAESSSL